LDAATYAILLAGALAGGFVSGLAGFGTALMALGIWLYILPPAISVPLLPKAWATAFQSGAAMAGDIVPNANHKNRIGEMRKCMVFSWLHQIMGGWRKGPPAFWSRTRPLPTIQREVRLPCRPVAPVASQYRWGWSLYRKKKAEPQTPSRKDW